MFGFDQCLPSVTIGLRNTRHPKN